jgi:MFS family permease
MISSRKWMITGGTAATLLAAFVLIALPAHSFLLSVALLCVIGFFGATYPVIMAHGRSFLPSHLIGRGVTMLNLFSVGGVGVAQFISGRVYRAALPAESPDGPYVAVFLLFGAALAVGFVIYLFSRDNSDRAPLTRPVTDGRRTGLLP